MHVGITGGEEEIGIRLPIGWGYTYRLGGGVKEVDCACYWCSCLRATSSDVLVPPLCPSPYRF